MQNLSLCLGFFFRLYMLTINTDPYVYLETLLVTKPNQCIIKTGLGVIWSIITYVCRDDSRKAFEDILMEDLQLFKMKTFHDVLGSKLGTSRLVFSRWDAPDFDPRISFLNNIHSKQTSNCHQSAKVNFWWLLRKEQTCSVDQSSVLRECCFIMQSNNWRILNWRQLDSW